jgi:RND family efflux transporter MFP subunit
MAVLTSLLRTWPGKAIAGLAVVAVVGGAIVAPRLGGAPAQEVRTAAVTRANVMQTVAVSGSVNAAGTVRLNFKSGGRLAEVLVRVGQPVVAGQPLARLDVTDLQVALKQAEVNLFSAQAKYDQTLAGATAEDIAIAKNSLDSAQKGYEQTQRTIQNDLTAAQQSLTKMRTAFLAAKTSFTVLVGTIRADVPTFTTAISTIKAEIQRIMEIPRVRDAMTGDPGIETSFGNARLALSNGETLSVSTLQPAFAEYTAALDALLAAVDAFDRAISFAADTTAASAAFQSAQANYQIAASRLSAALDAPGGQITSAQTAIAAAATSLNSPTLLADADLDRPRSDVRALQAAITNEQQLLSAMKSRITQATTALSGLAEPISGGYVTAVQNERTAQDKAAGSLSSQENALRSAQLSFEKTTAAPKAYDIATALASLQLQQIAVERARNDLDAATLRAPVAGFVASIASQPGEFVSGGGTAGFIVVANTASLTLHGTVGESEVAKLKLGQVATVAVDAVGSGTRMTGKIAALDPVATIQQGVPVYGVDVQIDLPDPAVRAGMTGTASVIIASKQGVLTIPNLAVRSQSGRRFVQVMRDGKVQDAEVAFGIQTDSVTEVMSGLDEGDQVVLPQARTTTATQQQIPQGAGVRLGGGPGGGAGQVPFR